MREEQPSVMDFSGYDDVSSEDLPDHSGHGLMKGYSDSSHYTLAVGRRLVARLFGGTDNWGVALSRSNIEVHLARIRAAQQLYRASHARDVAEIGALARETSACQTLRHSQPSLDSRVTGLHPNRWLELKRHEKFDSVCLSQTAPVQQMQPQRVDFLQAIFKIDSLGRGPYHGPVF